MQRSERAASEEEELRRREEEEEEGEEEEEEEERSDDDDDDDDEREQYDEVRARAERLLRRVSKSRKKKEVSTNDNNHDAGNSFSRAATIEDSEGSNKSKEEEHGRTYSGVNRRAETLLRRASLRLHRSERPRCAAESTAESSSAAAFSDRSSAALPPAGPLSHSVSGLEAAAPVDHPHRALADDAAAFGDQSNAVEAAVATSPLARSSSVTSVPAGASGRIHTKISNVASCEAEDEFEVEFEEGEAAANSAATSSLAGSSPLVTSVPADTPSRIQSKISNNNAAASSTSSSSPPPPLAGDVEARPRPSDGEEKREEEEAADAFVTGAAALSASGKVRGRTSDGMDIGATHVDEQAPQINRRYYLGLDRASVRVRNALARRRRREQRRRQEDANDDAGGGEGGGGTGRRGSMTEAGRSTEGSTSASDRTSNWGRSIANLVARVTYSPPATDGAEAHNPDVGVGPGGEHLISATLVEEDVEQRPSYDVGEVVHAERLGFFQRNWKLPLFALCLMGAVLAVVLPLSLLDKQKKESALATMNEQTDVPSGVPSMHPSSRPSFDPRPTLQIVQERGHVMCGVRDTTAQLDPLEVLCGAIAAVIFGDESKFRAVAGTSASRFRQLHGRDVDLLVHGDTHTVEREVKERKTGSGFSFSTPYFYDGMVYFGVEEFVNCAEAEKRHETCSSLRICVQNSTTHHDFVEETFPSDFFRVVQLFDDMEKMLSNHHAADAETSLNDSCNVIATDRLNLMRRGFATMNATSANAFSGHEMAMKEPLAIVTRNDDPEFSDIVNWVLQALFYGAERRLSKNPSLCREYPDPTSLDASDLDFLNAVYCVGNYDVMFRGHEKIDRGMNAINNGTAMIYAVPFGELNDNDDSDGRGAIADVTILGDVRRRRLINCGILVPEGFDGDLGNTRGPVGMSADYCRTLAAALFHGDNNLVNFTAFLEDDVSAYAWLNNESLDVLVGGKIEKEHDFGSPSSMKGVQFSTPYLYGNGTASDDVSFFSLATAEGDALFSSFVNCIVLATIYAEENDIVKKTKKQMPLISIFGSELKWALRDAVGYSGSYEEIYKKHFPGVVEENRGRNDLNEDGLPQIHSFPGLSS